MGFELFDYEGIIDILNGDIELSSGLFQAHQLVKIQINVEQEIVSFSFLVESCGSNI